MLEPVVAVVPAVVTVELEVAVLVVVVVGFLLSSSTCSLTTVAMSPLGASSRYFCQASSAASV